MDGQFGDGFIDLAGPMLHLGLIVDIIPLLDGGVDILGLYTGNPMNTTC